MTGKSGQSSWKIDPTKASVARVYDYLLGGKDNFSIDREMGEKLTESSPDVYDTAKLNREFGKRATQFIAGQGVRQFIDLGSGIPTTPPSVHDTARAIHADAHVVYVDNDPIVVAHSQALRDIGTGLESILADLNETDAILDHPGMTANIDFSKPVGVSIMSVLQTVTNTDDAYAVMQRFKDRMVPGSFLALSHISTRSAKAAVDNLHNSARSTGYPPLSVRTDEEILGFFDGLEVQEPGLVDIRDWRPDSEDLPSPKLKLSGAIARMN